MAKYDLTKISISLTDEHSGSWKVFGKIKTGKIKIYLVDDPLTGSWRFELRENDKAPQIELAVIEYPKERRYFAKLASQRPLFNISRLKSYMYNKISESYLDGTATSRTYLSKDDRKLLPSWVKSYFKGKIRLYRNAVLKGESSPSKNHLVVLIKRSNYEDFVRFFFATRIYPLTKYYHDKFK
jgi:hypothetical protein